MNLIIEINPVLFIFSFEINLRYYEINKRLNKIGHNNRYNKTIKDDFSSFYKNIEIYNRNKIKQRNKNNYKYNILNAFIFIFFIIFIIFVI